MTDKPLRKSLDLIDEQTALAEELNASIAHTLEAFRQIMAETKATINRLDGLLRPVSKTFGCEESE